METCANPGCEQPGTSGCASCRLVGYCSRTCQTAHWNHHREECQGHLRKVGMTHRNKANVLLREHNWPQALHHSDLAATKLKQLKDRPVEDLSDALECKCTALGFLGRYVEQLECAKEWYCLWNTKPTDVGAIDAAFALIESCITNKEYADAYLYSSTLYEIINHKHDNKIPDDQRQKYIARGAYVLAEATLRLARDGGIPSEEKQKAGQEAIALARKALEIHTQLFGAESDKVACDMCGLADALDFNDDENDEEEIIRLFTQTIAIMSRVYGSSSTRVATIVCNVGLVYYRRAKKAYDTRDLHRYVTNLELALPRYREATRIFRAVNRIDHADSAAKTTDEIEDLLRQIARAVAVTTTKG